MLHVGSAKGIAAIRSAVHTQLSEVVRCTHSHTHATYVLYVCTQHMSHTIPLLHVDHTLHPSSSTAPRVTCHTLHSCYMSHPTPLLHVTPYTPVTCHTLHPCHMSHTTPLLHVTHQNCHMSHTTPLLHVTHQNCHILHPNITPAYMCYSLATVKGEVPTLCHTKVHM